MVRRWACDPASLFSIVKPPTAGHMPNVRNNIAAPSFTRDDMAETESKVPSKEMHTVKVWDLATRVFHWLLVLLIVASWTTAQAKGNWMTWHIYSGYAILTLVLSRIAW